MFSTLLETRRRKQRSLGSTFMSAIMHVLLVTGAVYASAKDDPPEANREETQTYTEIKPEADPPPPKPIVKPLPPDAAPRLKGHQSIDIVINIPTRIPDADLTQSVTDERNWIPTGVRGGFFDGDADVKPVRTDSTYFVTEVDKVARLLSGPEPNYPSILKQTRQEGSVKVQFVIDTAGKAEMNTVKILESTNSLFSDEVKKVLSKYNFVPAQIGARKVRLEVVLPFEFKLDPKGGGGQ